MNKEIKLAIAYAIASIIPDDELNEDNIIANVFNPKVVEVESEAVAQATKETGVALYTTSGAGKIFIG